MPIFDSKLCLSKLCLALFFPCPISLHAEADGPDFYRLKTGDVIELRANSEITAESLIKIPGNTDGLENLGCQGLPAFHEWSAMTPAEQVSARDNAWCKVEYLQVAGWIPQKYLEEGAGPSPSFDCSAAQGEVEKLICDNTELMSLDNHLHYVYQAAMEKAGNLDAGTAEAVHMLEATQRGWIKGRNECWKELDTVQECVYSEYQQRIAYLQAKWMLIATGHTYHYTCPGNAEFTISFYNTDTIPAVAVEFGDNRVVMLATRTASGSRYDGLFGRYVWLKQHEAMFVWDQYQKVMTCSLDMEFRATN